MTDAKAKAKAQPRIAPIGDLSTIKDDLGIPVDDTTNDAWLSRRIDAIWSRFQSYTGRVLALSGPWIDSWQEISRTNVHHIEPRAQDPRRRASVFLRVFPVQSVDAIVINNADGDPASVLVDGTCGKVLSLDPTHHDTDCGPALLYGQAVINYTAGFTEIPGDLYQALIACLEPLWAVRQAQQAGFGGMGGGVTRISATDVGEVDFTYGLAGFAVDASKKSAPDPLLGPWAVMLDPYVDWRAFIGSENYPTTTQGVAP